MDQLDGLHVMLYVLTLAMDPDKVDLSAMNQLSVNEWMVAVASV